MPKTEKRKSLKFDKQGVYHIRVQGVLDESWSERLGGMRITTDKSERHLLSDQAMCS